jgi:hypothetical protein
MQKICPTIELSNYKTWISGKEKAILEHFKTLKNPFPLIFLFTLYQYNIKI